MEWFGHVWRSNNGIIKKVLTETIYLYKERPTWSSRTRWNDAVEKDIKMYCNETCQLTWHLIGKDGKYCLWQEPLS